jgi:GT2 family glycosyltransferase
MKPISFCINTTAKELEYLKLLLRSLKEGVDTNLHEIIIFVENHTEESLNWIKSQKSEFSNLKLMINNLPVCYGYARNINEMFKIASNDIVSYLQSDMIVGKGYDQDVLAEVKPNMILSATRIEPPLHGPGSEKHTMNFGLTPADFKYDLFQMFCESNKQDKQTQYFFAPFTLYKDVWNSIGGHDTTFRRSREDSDILNRFVLNGVEIVQTWNALVYHFTCTSSRGQDWFNKENTQAQQRVLVQQQADGIELARINRKWGNFSHGTPLKYHYNIEANIDVDEVDLGKYIAIEQMFSKVFINSEELLEKIKNVSEHVPANYLLNFSKEDWDRYKYLYNQNNIEDRVEIGHSKGDVILSFKMSDITQETYGAVLMNLQSIIDAHQEGVYAFDDFTFKIRFKNNNIQDLIKVSNPEIQEQDLYTIYN